jgi:hypothetical protein
MRFVSDFILFLLGGEVLFFSSLVNPNNDAFSRETVAAIQLTPLMKREVGRGLLQIDD